VNDDPLQYLFTLEQFGIKFGLDNITALVTALGHPDHSFRSIHIAGTNGKGSVTAMLDAVLRAAGHRTARYTSPHLVDLSERFVIDGHPADQRQMRAAIAHVRDAATRLQEDGTLPASPTFFEVTTAVAFELFRRAGVTVAVCEVGLGGRLDATNVLMPVLTAITSIAFDHQQYLGNTLTEIALEKAGIIKPGVPVVIGSIANPAGAAIEQVADERHAPLFRAHDEFEIDQVRLGEDGIDARLKTAAHDYGTVHISLAGRHQVDNAIVAIRILELLPALGIAVSSDDVRNGLASVRWPGRLERIVLDDGRELLLDAAHNPAGASALASYLAGAAARQREQRQDEHSGGRPIQPPPLVFAAMRDKDTAEMLRILAPEVGAIIMTRASNRRSAEPVELAEAARRIAPALPVTIAETLDAALAAAWRIAPRIVVAGSIFLLGDVIERLGRP
jgi:dihydrofolate synthase/folylpolyglutamate synthase